jgi:hybrid cluster-associated redox disulfide protein
MAENAVAPNTPKVTKESNLAEVIFKYPQVAEILTDYGLHCVGCFASSFDTIRDASVIHSMSDEEIEEMVDRVNELIETGE